MGKWLIGVCMLTLAGCATQVGPDPYLQAQIGHSELDVIHAMGVPVHSYTTEGHHFLAFEQKTQWVDNWGGGGWGWRHGWGGWGGPTEIDDYVCQVSFEFVNDRAIGYQLHGNGC